MSTRDSWEGWNGWYHLIGCTYGTWIRGDERGWRARHHREHVEGDYRSPPPITAHVRERAYSRKVTGTPVHLSPAARRIACDELVASLLHQEVQVIACAVDDHHFHILARFIQIDDPGTSRHHRPIYATIRHIGGLAKSRSSRAISDNNLAASGGIWAKRFQITPITDREHQVRAYFYIREHAARGAATWLHTSTSA